MNITPEANTFLIEVGFEFVNKGAIGMAVGDEERGDLDGLRSTEVKHAVLNFDNLFVGELGVVEPGWFNFPITQAATAKEYIGNFAFR